ncbi:hypothetical protein ABZX95_39625 [Streptomyces sp. NPDC004232]|uniref:SWIM zinc finger family protein n=1 Tax=Streptomyces sp. NPDC004232 TaxID=3154454 RepID=UPI0033B16A4B
MAQDLDFDEDDLRALAGPRSFERGQKYLAAVEVGDGWITGIVHGTDAYQAELTLDGPDGLAGECDCPYGVEGTFCKHLIDYLCDRYARGDRLIDAVALRRTQFAARRSLVAYQQLRTVARAAGCWQVEREPALVLLRTDAGQRQRSWHGGPVLVDALLDDGDVDAAWGAAAETRAHDRQWLALADRARIARPADALGVYLRLAEPLMKQTGNTVYDQLTGLLLSMRDCHHRLGTEDEFTAYLAALRAGQKRKRNLMRLLDQHGL